MTDNSGMTQLFQFGEDHPNYPVRVLNESKGIRIYDTDPNIKPLRTDRLRRDSWLLLALFVA